MFRWKHMPFSPVYAQRLLRAFRSRKPAAAILYSTGDRNQSAFFSSSRRRVGSIAGLPAPDFGFVLVRRALATSPACLCPG